MSVVLLVPVTDYREFLAQLHPVKPDEKVTEVEAMGKFGLAANRGHYAILAAPQHRKAIQAMLEFKHGIDADLADLRPWLAENEVAAVATTRGIKLVCDMGIKTALKIRKDVRGHST